MKTISIAVSLFCVSAVCTASSLRSDIEAMNAKVTSMLKKKDVDGFAKVCRPYMTSDFKYIENGQSMSFDEMVKNMREGVGMMKKVTVATTKILSLKMMGADKAVCMEDHQMGGTMMGPDKKMHTMVFKGTSSSKYVKMHGKWMMSEMSWKNQKMTMDGKPFDPSKMQGAPEGMKKD